MTLALLLTQIIPVVFAPVGIAIPTVSVSTDFPLLFDNNFDVVSMQVVGVFRESLYSYTARFKTAKPNPKSDFDILFRSFRLLMAIAVSKSSETELNDDFVIWSIIHLNLCEENDEYQGNFLSGVSEILKQIKMRQV